jgi:hypothetical protein
MTCPTSPEPRPVIAFPLHGLVILTGHLASFVTVPAEASAWRDIDRTENGPASNAPGLLQLEVARDSLECMFEEYTGARVRRRKLTVTFPGYTEALRAFLQPGDLIEFEQADGPPQLADVLPPTDDPLTKPYQIVLRSPLAR